MSAHTPVFSRAETGVFLAASLLLGWALYPSEYTRGLMHRESGDRSAAVAFFQDYLRRHPHHKGATLALASAYEAGGRPEEGVEPLLEFYRHRRGDLETGRAVLDLLDRTGDQARADAFRWELIEDLRKKRDGARRPVEELVYAAFRAAAARQDDEATLRALKTLAEVSGDEAGYRSEMIRLLMARGRVEAAIAMISESARKDPKNADLRRMLVRLKRMAGDVDGALEEARLGLAASPRSVDLRAERLSILMAAKRFPEAEAELKELISLEPNDPSWLRELAQVKLLENRPEDAAKLFRALLQRAPQDKDLRWSIVYSYADRGEHEAAARELEQFLARFPGDEKAFRALIDEYEASGRGAKSLEALRRRVAAAPRDEESRRKLLALLVEDEKYAEAAPHYKALIALHPDEGGLYLDSAWLDETRGAKEDAAKTLTEYLRRKPGDGRAVERLAGLLLELDRRHEAAELLKRYLKPGATPPAKRSR